MHSIFGIVCACFFYVGSGRRVQTSATSALLFSPSGARMQHHVKNSASSGLHFSRRAPPLASSVAVDIKPDQEEIVAVDIKPGQEEKTQFQCDPSCARWEEFRIDGEPNPVEDLQAAAAIVAKYLPSPLDPLANASAVEYWAKHAARMTYFIGNAVAGTTAFQVARPNKPQTDQSFKSPLDDPQQLALTASRLILESIMTFEQDWLHISKGHYAPPWDMYTAGHRQTTIPYALRQSARFVREAVETLGRRATATPEDREIWLDASNDLYPEYYKTNFHYQTDGWMSADSAAVYETSTETLFLGKQDAMQRASLVPLQGLKGTVGKPPKILEVACGTGRFATFLRDNHPTAELTCVDLSPFYLEAARENDEYWRKTKKNTFGNKPIAPATFVQAAAEALPFDTESFDAVVCVYLFHEMPEGARAAAAAEMARVLKPGGTLVLTDSMQRGDRPSQDDVIVNFERLNEPHYRNYIDTNLASIFVPHGLECRTKELASSSKTISFEKVGELGN